MKNMKIMFLCIVMIVGTMMIPSVAYAGTDLATDLVIRPMFTYVDTFNNDFDVSDDGEASVFSYLSFRNADQARIVVYLERYMSGSWVVVKSWTTTSTTGYGNISSSYNVSSGAQYRMRSFGYVFVDGKIVESVSYESSPVWY